MLFYTSAVADAFNLNPDLGPYVAACYKRHARGDWGDAPLEDKALNDASAKAAFGTLHSVYKSPVFPEIWIITDPDRATTTIMFPADY